MSKLSISIATGRYDRVQALRDGRVAVEGCEVNHHAVGPEELFFRAFRHHEFDVCEASMSSYLTSVDRGDTPYTAIPVFLSRVFRHSSIYIRTDRGIAAPQDLKGRRVGVPEYQVTGALWARGLLDDEYGVRPTDVSWFTGGLHEAGRHEKVALRLPPQIDISPIGDHATLDAMLAAGELDALITPRVPGSYTRRAPHVGRLFPDYHQVEREYYARTGIFPIMHVVLIRRSLVQAHPWLANAVYGAFIEARALAMRQLEDVSAHSVMLPWLGTAVDETIERMGPDYWPYGVQDNLRTLKPMLDYAHRHGTTSRRLALEELFVPSTLDRHKV
jgi:4,5-dihydroxyphthalate decarboxylase